MKNNNKVIVLEILIFQILLLVVSYSFGNSRMATAPIPFKGTATGGELILTRRTSERNMPIVSIQTQAGESAESVAERLAKYIHDNNDSEYFNRWVSARGGVLKGLWGGAGNYFLAGTEMGLGIPLPAYSFSCTYNEKTNTLSLNWENPPGGYDKIQALGPELKGNATSCTTDLDEWSHVPDINNFNILLIGINNETYVDEEYCRLASVIGAIHISNKGRVQEEIFGIPFKNGVTPNWKAWSVEGVKQEQMVEGSIRKNYLNNKINRYEKHKQLTSDPSTKPFYQLIKTGQQGGTAGIYRQFLGLIGGHTYRLSARLSTLESDSNKNNWSYSLHAVADRKGKGKLNETQMAGLVALPNGKKGLDAGRIANYDSSKNTKGEFEATSTDVTLPQDSNSITVWLRLTGENTNGVGFDWIRLEDLGRKASPGGGEK